MKNIMKVLSLVMVIALFPILAACSSGGASGASSASSAATVKGETFDGGNISVLVPEGWAAFHGTDVFKDYDEGYNPNEIDVIKGGSDESDMLSNPYVMITYYENGSSYISPKSIYSDATDIDPITAGDYEWTGFTAGNVGYPTAILSTEVGDSVLTAIIVYENGDMKISLDDPDVQAILGSVAINAG